MSGRVSALARVESEALQLTLKGGRESRENPARKGIAEVSLKGKMKWEGGQNIAR
jgi:hypothetical protein